MSYLTEKLQSDLRLIQEVERHSNLYDHHCRVNSRKLREITWTIIGQKLNRPPIVCKNRWRNLRDKYTREKKLIIERENFCRKHPWPLFDDMSFLWNFVNHRNRPQLENFSSESGSVNYSFSNFYNVSDDNNSVKPSFLDAECMVDEDGSLLSNNNEDCTPPNALLRSQEEEICDTLNENFTGFSYQPDSVPILKNPELINSLNEEKYFCMSLAASLKRLPRKKSSLLKVKIMQILYEAQ